MSALQPSTGCLFLLALFGCDSGAPATTAIEVMAPAAADTEAPMRPSVGSDAGATSAAESMRGLRAADGGPVTTAFVDAGPIRRPPPATPATFARPALCERADGRTDVVRRVFCADQPPSIAGLADLEAVIDLQTQKVVSSVYTGAVLLGHSTSLSGHVVSEINPRVIVMTPKLFVAFQRGVQQVEIAVQDQNKPTYSNYYLIAFTQSCNAADGGCKPGDLYTPSIESNWMSFTLADDEDLKNTAFDCRQCHQRARETPALLMRELDGPWTHYFGPEQEDAPGYPEATGTALLRDFIRAKGDESYANLPTATIRRTIGISLQILVARPQPLLFNGSQIVNERWPSVDGTYAPTPAKSKTWYDAYEAFKRGEQLALPYFEPRVTDVTKQQRLTAAYQSYVKGELPASELPDLADIFPDDPQTRAEIGLQTEPGATPAQTLIQACGTCHNDVLDQTVSRARFNVALNRMDRAAVAIAIARMEQPPGTLGVMPPRGRRAIADGQLVPLIDYLKQEKRSEEDDAMLEHAAQIGMSGGSVPGD